MKHNVVKRYVEGFHREARVEEWRGPPPDRYWGPGYLESLHIPSTFIDTHLLPYNSWGYLIWLSADRQIRNKWDRIAKAKRGQFGDRFTLRDVTFGDFDDNVREGEWKKAINEFKTDLNDRDTAVMQKRIGTGRVGLDEKVVEQLSFVGSSSFIKMAERANDVGPLVSLVEKLYKAAKALLQSLGLWLTP